MGACCGKGSGPADPDKAPYGAAPATPPPRRPAPAGGKEAEVANGEAEPLLADRGQDEQQQGGKGVRGEAKREEEEETAKIVDVKQGPVTSSDTPAKSAPSSPPADEQEKTETKEDAKTGNDEQVAPEEIKLEETKAEDLPAEKQTDTRIVTSSSTKSSAISTSTSFQRMTTTQSSFSQITTSGSSVVGQKDAPSAEEIIESMRQKAREGHPGLKIQTSTERVERRTTSSTTSSKPLDQVTFNGKDTVIEQKEESQSLPQGQVMRTFEKKENPSATFTQSSITKVFKSHGSMEPSKHKEDPKKPAVTLTSMKLLKEADIPLPKPTGDIKPGLGTIQPTTISTKPVPSDSKPATGEMKTTPINITSSTMEPTTKSREPATKISLTTPNIKESSIQGSSSLLSSKTNTIQEKPVPSPSETSKTSTISSPKDSIQMQVSEKSSTIPTPASPKTPISSASAQVVVTAVNANVSNTVQTSNVSKPIVNGSHITKEEPENPPAIEVNVKVNTDPAKALTKQVSVSSEVSGEPLEEEDLDELFITEEADDKPVTLESKLNEAKSRLPGPSISPPRSIASRITPPSKIATPRSSSTTSSNGKQGSISPPPAKTKLSQTFSNASTISSSSIPDSNVSNGSSTPDIMPRKDSVPLANMKKSIKSQLIDMTTANENVVAQHSIVANPKSKILGTIENWFSGKDQGSRAMIIKGASGVGKTCLAAQVVQKYKRQVAGSHFFQYNNSNLDHNFPRATILSLAHSFCDIFTNYSSSLPKMDKLEDIVDNGKLEDLYNVLIKEALGSGELDHDGRPMMVVLDGVDEALFTDRDMLCNIISNFDETAPSWLYLLVTVRDDNQLVSLIQSNNVTILELKPSNETLLDVKRILKEPMGKYMDRISLDGGLTQLAKKSQQSLVFGKIMAKRLNNMKPGTKIAMREIEGRFPTGLNGALTEIFSKFEEFAVSKESRDVYDYILGILTVAREPIDIAFVEECCTLSSSEVLDLLQDVLNDTNGKVAFLHRCIGDWLCMKSESGNLNVTLSKSRDKLADLMVKWIEPVLDEEQHMICESLTGYALKHGVSHLLEVPKRQEDVAKLLCSLRLIQARLQLEDVDIKHVIRDYSHEHVQFPEEQKIITIGDYMKKQQKLVEHINSYYKFLVQKQTDIRQSPDFILHIAANYPSVQRIQGNARLALSKQTWLEDMTAVPETHSLDYSVGGRVQALDAAPDGKFLAVVVTDDDYNVHLHLVIAATGEEKCPPVDIKNLKDRVGLCCKFTPDGSGIFVGSLTTLITFKGKVAPSYLEMQSMDLKEKFAIECCDTSSRYLVAGLNTFPFGGRSMHLSLFDWKTKKCLTTIEVLRFRFGGSSQFGTRCCALSGDDSLLAACVKQGSKPQARVSVWQVGSWKLLHNIDVNSDYITKCIFVGSDYLVMGSSVARIPGSKDDEDTPRMKTEVWALGERTSRPLGGATELCSLYTSATREPTFLVSWRTAGGSANVACWQKTNIAGPTTSQCTLRGLHDDDATDVVAAGSTLVFVAGDGRQLRAYNVNDLDVASNLTDDSLNPTDLVVESVAFLPRSDTAIVAHQTSNKDEISVSLLDIDQDDLQLTSTPLHQVPIDHPKSPPSGGLFQYFHSSVSGSSRHLLGMSPDGKLITLNTGHEVRVWKREGGGGITNLPKYDEVDKTDNTVVSADDQHGLHMVTSVKDSLVALVYAQRPCCVHLFDLRSGSHLRMVSLAVSDPKAAISDVAFMPSTGHLVTYHRELGQKLVVWSVRNGQPVSVDEPVSLSYARLSPASDRMVLSLTNRSVASPGELVLRSSDAKFRCTLAAGAWPPGTNDSDVEFSADGTVVVGVAAATCMCRLWNGGNGDLLRDLDIMLTGATQIPGMVTNTHVMLQEDGRLIVVDVTTGQIGALTALTNRLSCRSHPKGLSVSPRGGVIVGGTDRNGQIRVYRPHNMEAVKRMSTLQRLKSVTSPTKPR